MRAKRKINGNTTHGKINSDKKRRYQIGDTIVLRLLKMGINRDCRMDTSFRATSGNEAQR